MHHLKFIAAALLVLGCTPKEEITCYTDYVDPKIGSGGHGHVFVGANVPFGMVQLGPTSIRRSGTGALATITAIRQ